MSQQHYNAIFQRYRFTVPEEYRRLESRGCFAHPADLPLPESYLEMTDMEWYSPQEIAEFEFVSFHMPTFVPFAQSGAGDLWCWHPDHVVDDGAHVMFCPCDFVNARIYAPNFPAALYRQILQYCRDEWHEEEPTAMLRRWAIDLADIFPARWIVSIERLADDPRRSATAVALDAAEIQFPAKDTEIRWMLP